jgi:hypothetical protein
MTQTKFLDVEEERPTLEEAQEFVGGYVELICSRIYPKTQLLIDEEGLCKPYALNKVASVIAGCTIVGNAIVLTGKARWMPD